MDDGAALHLLSNSGAGLQLFQNFVLAGLGVDHPYSVIDQQGAIVNLVGKNVITGNIKLKNQVGIGVQPLDGVIMSAQPSGGSDTTAGFESELTLTGSQSNFSTTPAGGITKLGSERLTIQGDGNYTGLVDIVNGVLRVQNDTALGAGNSNAAAAGTIVRAGTSLELMGSLPEQNGGLLNSDGSESGLGIWNEKLTLNGTGNNAFGHKSPLAILQGDHLWHGNVTLGDDTLDAVVLNVPTDTRLSIFGVIDDVPTSGADLIKIGEGELILAGRIPTGAPPTSAPTPSPTSPPTSRKRHSAWWAICPAASSPSSITSPSAPPPRAPSLMTAPPCRSRATSPSPASRSPSRAAAWLMSPAPSPSAGSASARRRSPTAPSRAPIRPTSTSVAALPASPSTAPTPTSSISRPPAAGPAHQERRLDLGTHQHRRRRHLQRRHRHLAQDPTVLYLGTGETNASNSFASAYYGSGVYKSIDSGRNWEQVLDPTAADPNPLDRRAVSKIIVDPTNEDRIFVAVGDQAKNGMLGNAGVWRRRPRGGNR